MNGGTYMTEKTYRDLIYKGYLKDIKTRQMFSSNEKERKMIIRYVKRNYLSSLPKNRNAKILDLGCGMGHYLYALKALGYKNIIGVDTSSSNVEFCLSQGLNVVKEDALTYLKDHPEEFEGIIFNDVIEHFDKNEIVDVLFAIKGALHSRGGG